MELTSITEVWKLFKWLPNFILRKIFNKQLMAGLVRVDIQPRFRPVEINLSEKSAFEIYFEIINMSPFEVTLSTAEISFIVNGSQLTAQHILRRKYAAGSIESWFVRGDIQQSDANRIALNHEREKAQVGIEIDFSCILHDFKKGPLALEGVNFNLSNLNWRLQEIEKSST